MAMTRARLRVIGDMTVWFCSVSCPSLLLRMAET